MNRVLAAACAIAFLCAAPNHALAACGFVNQICIVPTQKPGTSDNRAASTEFVQKNGIGGIALSGVPAAGYVPIATGPTTAVWGSLGALFTDYSGPLGTTNTTVPGSFSTPAYFFMDSGTTGLSFSDAETHFSYVVIGNTPASGTGSYNAFISQQYADGRSPSAYATGAQFQAIVTRGGGNITGSNPVVIVCGSAVIAGQCPHGTAAATQSVVGEEIDLFGYAGASAVYKQGLRIYDFTPFDAVGAGTLSAAINIGKGTASGWQNGILFGDPNVPIPDNSFPVPTGALIKASTVTTEPASGIDFSGMVGFVNCAICLPANAGMIGINFGALGFNHGGRIISETTVNAADLIFNNNVFSVQYGGSFNAIIGTPTGVFLGGNINVPNVTTGTPAASLCLDAGGNIIKKTTTGPCI
jgi:hypothetical protein